MATLDDKLMGEKLHYYCSSSEDEDDDKPKFVPDAEASAKEARVASNTGPKGVIEDWRRFKQLERENRAESEREKAELAKKLTMTCKSEREEREEKEKEEKLDEELEALLDDEFLADYMAKRMREMMELNNSKNKEFGRILELNDAERFLKEIDEEEKDILVVVFIHEEEVPGCEAMAGCIKILAQEYKSVKFCQIKASTAGLSRHFKVDGVPALLVYKAKELVTSFVRMTDVLGEDFFAADVESLLIEHGVLSDKDLVPKIIRGPANDDDSD